MPAANKPNKDARERWEYKTIYCNELALEFDENKEQIVNSNIPQERRKATNPYILDPKIELPSNEAVSWQMAWSEKGKYWTGVVKALNELGDEGWELVSVTPPWNSIAVASSSVNIGYYVPPYINTNYHHFHLLLKRLKIFV